MSFDTLLQNLGFGEIAVAPSPGLSGLTFTLGSGQGSLFPAEGPYTLGICPGGTSPPGAFSPNVEYVVVEKRVGDVFTLSARNTNTEKNSTARTVQVGDRVFTAATERVLRQLREAIEATKPAVANTGRVYVSTVGNDANSGARWSEAKRTGQRAIEALPVGVEGNHNGIVEWGYGQFNEESIGRTDTGVETTAKSALVKDTHIKAEDLNAYVRGLAEDARIIRVTPGVSFEMDRTYGSTETTTIVIDKPAIVSPPGVRHEGVGRKNGLNSGESLNNPTLVKDKGTGTTLQIEAGEGEKTKSYAGWAVKFMTFAGEGKEATTGTHKGEIEGGSALAAIRCKSITGGELLGVEAREYNEWGIIVNSQALVAMNITNCEARNNGTNGTARATGGFLFENAPNMSYMANCRALKNWGVGYNLSGIVAVACEGSHNFKTESVNSGRGWNPTGSGPNGQLTIIGGWSEGNDTAEMGGVQSGTMTVIGHQFRGKAGSGEPAYGIEAGGGMLVLKSSYFEEHATASIKENNAGSNIKWSCCTSLDALWIKRVGGAANVAAGAAKATDGYIGGFTYTAPLALEKLKLTSGTPWQNTTGRDVRVMVPVNFEVVGKAEVKLGPTSPGEVLGTISPGVASTDIAGPFYVPALAYLTVVLTAASFTGEATVQPA